ncbi:MAG: hypothetical protein ACKVOW_13075, partial [Chitinophagaceae bacterium]
KKRFDFIEKDQPIANTNYPKRFQKKALITSGNYQWDIQRTGWWKHVLEISAQQTPYNKWSLPINWRGNLAIRTEDNRQFRFKRKGFWKTAWVWLNEKEEEVMEIKICQWPKKKRGSVISNHFSDVRDLLFLAQIGWFVALAAIEDSAAAASF